MKLLKEDWDWDGEVPKIADYINDQFAGREEITRDEFDEAFEDAIMGLLGELPDYHNQTVRVDKRTRDLWELETDVRTILEQSGWETVYEGDNAGGLRVISDEPTDYDRRAVEQDYGLEDGELDGVDIHEAERMIGEEEGALDRYINEELNTMNKKLNETWAGEDSLQDLIDRAKIKYNDDNTKDIDDIVWETIDEGLIYSRDIWNLAEHYGVIDDGELIERFYDDLYSDIEKELKSYSGEEPEEVEEEEEISSEDIEESLKKPLEESITVKLDEDEALDMLMNRVEEFGDYHPGDVEYALYEKMYENAINSGVFDGTEFNVMTIVDNDIVNYCTIIGPEDENYQTIVDLYDTQGLGDISSESDYGYIEAVEKEDGKNYFLLRY